MPARAASARKLARVITVTVDVVLFTPQAGELCVLVISSESGRGRSRDRWTLPSSTLGSNETLDDAAIRVAREAIGVAPASLEQAVASGGQIDVTITYFGLVPSAGVRSTPHGSWISATDLANVGARQIKEIEVALSTMRARIDQQPIAFSLLPPTFTLSELQSIYELLIGRRLHKASFRRSLRASSLVEATDEWRSEGRGRPAQLFRYAPPRRRRLRRGIRFDLLG
jgi:ADP-ribose pyrophosphatase YjhB (NUDIX family)